MNWKPEFDELKRREAFAREMGGPDKIKRQQGMDITIVTSAPTDAEALDLLKLMGFPFAEGK